MINREELGQTLAYMRSEMQRLETMAGTLSQVEQQHYRKLTGFDHADLLNIAMEEQSASRQLGTMKQICLALAGQISELETALVKDGDDLGAH